MFEDVLKSSFNLSSFRTGQKEVIAAVIAGHDALAVLPTGAGKSLCFQFPAIYSQKLVIVISPLIALMKDQVYSLRKRGIPAGCLYSGQTEDDKRQIFSDINKGGAFVLYLSPERVQKEGFQKWILHRPLALFAVDEAHCVSQWGHDFREEYAGLKVLKNLRPDVPVLALTASATPTVLDDVAKNLQLKNPKRLVHGFYRENLYYQVETCIGDDDKFHWILQGLKQAPQGRVLIYCGTRKSTEDLAQKLSHFFKDVGFYHAGLRTEERSAVQESYQNGETRILVATNAFGMGIDQPDVRLVIHFQMPANIDSLYQEMGRAGRDGLPSTCLMLYAKKDKGLQSFFIQSSVAEKAIKELRWRNLEALVSYSEAGECRHAEILTYYKDAERIKACGHCDVCDSKSNRKIADVQPPPKVSLKKSKSGKNSETELSAEDELRFQNLRRWRKQKADELDIPAFVVFSDRTLKEIASKNPTAIEDLKSVFGIGESKLEKFGWDLIAELNSHQ